MHPKRLLSGLAASALAVSCLASAPAAHADDQDLGRMSDYIALGTSDTTGQFVKDRWLVRVAGASVLDGGSTSSVRAAQKSVVNAAAKAGVRIKGQRSYSRTFNGMAISLDARQVAKLAKVPGVTGIYPVATVDRPVQPGSPTTDPAMAHAVSLTGAAIARDDLGYDGSGVKVGVIDSGIDIDHPDLGGSGTNGTTAFPTSRVKWGTDFVGDDYDANDEASLPVPDAVPDDCGGHGTHVAGIIGAAGDPAAKGVTGVAPKASFGAYRVFGCDGSSSTEVILAAMERATADGMDVVNMSLGADMASWPDYPTATAADAMVKDGVVVVASAGNSGEEGAWSAGAPSVGKRAISVASFDNTHVTQPAVRVAGQLHGYSAASDGAKVPQQGSLPLVALADPADDASKGCEPWGDDLVAKVARAAVLVQRGTCSFHEKALAAQRAGAKAVVLYNNAAGTLSPSVKGDEPITIPVLLVSQAAGQAMVAAAGAEGAVLEFTDQVASSADPNGGRISSFSSWGLGADLSLKPDLGAPGGNIWSTYPLEKGGHTSMSGTSMAAPHTAGSVALLLQARPGLKGKPAKVQQALMNTASHDALWSFNPELGLVEPVIRQGAGLIQVDRAILAQQAVAPSKISLGEQKSAPVRTTLTLSNSARRAVVYTLSNQTSIGTLGTSDPQFDLLDARVDMPAKVVVPAKGKVQVTVSIQAPADAPQGYVYGGWIVARSATGATLNVPYVGMAGDYQRVDVLNGPDGSTPCLAEVVDGRAVCLDEQAGQSYSMGEQDQPTVMFRMEYPVEKLQLAVHRVNADGTTTLLGHALDLGREGRGAGDLSISWDGTYQTLGRSPYLAKASAGQYRLELRALRPLGKEKKAADWQTWTSEAFTARFDAKAPAEPGGAVVDPTAIEGVRS